MQKPRKLKLLLVGLSNLSQNYGAQAIACPLVNLLKKQAPVDITFVLGEHQFMQSKLFARSLGAKAILNPYPYYMRDKFILFGVASAVLYRKKLAKYILAYKHLICELKEADAVIDISGIEFIGDSKRKWREYLSTSYVQYLAKKYRKPYFKFTKSYGPFTSKVYVHLVRRKLNALTFCLVRGDHNREAVARLNLTIPICSFPDISFAVAADRAYAKKYLAQLGIDGGKGLVGISPSAVIYNMSNKDNSCGANHARLCKGLIRHFQSQGKQILLLPHSFSHKSKDCDLALCENIYATLVNKTGVFLLTEALDYSKVRSIISVLDFYVTARYHSLTSALSCAIPVVSLSWHTKYRDAMALYLNDFLAIDSKKINANDALAQIKDYYLNQKWFDKSKMQKRHKNVLRQIAESVKLIADRINYENR